MKLTRALLSGCLLLALWCQPVGVGAETLPGPVKDFDAFYNVFTQNILEGEYARAAGWVRANPKFAKSTYAVFRDLPPAKRPKDPALKMLEQRLISVIAVELTKMGDRSVQLEAKKRGWYLADMVNYRPHPRLSIDAPGYGPLARAGNWAFGRLVISSQLGDSESLQPAVDYVRSVGLRLQETNQRLKLVVLDDPLAEILPLSECMPIALEAVRGNTLAVKDGEFFDRMQKLAEGTIPESDFFVALRRNGSPARLEKMLAEGRRRGRVQPGTRRQFVYQTYEVDLRLQRDSKVSPEELLSLHDQAFQSLRQVKDLDLSNVPEQELAIWFELLTGLLSQPRFGERAQAALGDDLAFLQKVIDATELEPTGVPEGWNRDGHLLALLLKEKRILLSLARAYWAKDRRRQARQVLQICGSRVWFRDRWQTLLADLEKAMQAQAPTADLAILARQGIVMQPGKPHWREGYFARLMEDWCTLEMALQEDPTALPELFAEADKFGKLARRHLGWMGFDDPRWFYLGHLFGNHPGNDWQARAEPVLASLQADCDRLAFRPGQARLLAYRAELQKASDPDGALKRLNEAVALVENYLNEFGASPNAREKLEQAYQPIYSALAQLQIEHGKAEQAFETLQRQQLADAVNRNSANLAANPRAEALLKVRGKGQELGALFQANAQAGRDNTQTQQLLAQNKAEFHTVLTDLRRQYPNYESALAVRPTNFSKSQKYLPKDAAIVQYFPTVSTLYIFVVTHDKLVIRQVPLGQKQLEREVSKLMREMFKPVESRLASYSFSDRHPSMAPLCESLQSLHQALITPIESDLTGAKVLAFIPTGSLHYVPFSALARPRGQGLEFLVERYPCVNLVKSSDLDQVGRQATSGGGGLLALGNPDGSLPGAEREVGRIAKQFSQSKKLIGKQATSQSLKGLDPGISYLHMATHGVLDSHDPKKSYLLMAGSQLTVPEIYELDLEGVRLVTLSACQTAREGNSPGSEISSLAEAFSVAGTNSVVASLWSISDDATEKLMGEFYKGLISEQSVAISLQQAELSLLKDPATAHPFFWAPFVMLGDWR